MAEILKSSFAYVAASSGNVPFIIQSTFNAEKVLASSLREYLIETDFSSMYPNFNVRVGTVHPFALLLYEDVSGQKVNIDVFPSITISDSSETENNVSLSRGMQSFMLTEADVIKMKGYKDRGELLCSDENMVRLEAAVKQQNVYAELLTLRSTHNVDLNIWADNKKITSILYDITRMFLLSKIASLHKDKIDMIGTLSGRRSGDINVEFGKILYGANVSVSLAVTESVMRVDLALTNIQSVKIQQKSGEFYYDEGGE